MAKITLVRKSIKETDQGSVYEAYSNLEYSLRLEHDLILLPDNIHSLSDISNWVTSTCENSDIIISNYPEIVYTLRENGWKGKLILPILGNLPRGGAWLRRGAPYLTSEDIIWCTSTSDQLIYQNLINHDYPHPESVVLPLQVDTNRFYPFDYNTKLLLRNELGIKPDEFSLAYTGRITVEKNIHSILEVVYLLQRSGKKIKLFIVGDFFDVFFYEHRVSGIKLRERIEKLVKSYGLSNSVVYKPWLSKDKLNQLFNAVDAFVNLTFHHDENFGLSQVEAMSAGLPVVGALLGVV
ncbi:hypothetical protein ACA29_07315 [Lederbergia galactosidilytica]|uniref:Glycosyl transferase family 1 domain-containing protein n=1 Tax=Lederbergia galactosidilytica TaxID=217031 RepID=A0A0Q9XZ89_9BACI|nr:hypothetical protein ACA29_07315 [Lederbergia galactosidilytica]